MIYVIFPILTFAYRDTTIYMLISTYVLFNKRVLNVERAVHAEFSRRRGS